MEDRIADLTLRIQSVSTRSWRSNYGFSEIDVASRDLKSQFSRRVGSAGTKDTPSGCYTGWGCSEATTESTSNGMLSWKQLVQGDVNGACYLACFLICETGTKIARRIFDTILSPSLSYRG